MTQITSVELTVELLDTDVFDTEIEAFASEIVENQFGEGVQAQVVYSNQPEFNNLTVFYADGTVKNAHLDTGWIDSIVNAK